MQTMKFSSIFLLILAVGSLPAAAQARGQNAATPPPVPYATANQVNALLSQLESNATSTASDLSRLRISKWKAPGGAKQQSESNRQSILRNLETALPGMISAVRANPDDIAASFTLYRNLDALYDVLSSVAEGAGAFGPKDDLQALSNDLSTFEGTRKQLAERIESLSSAKEAEIVRLRTDLKTAQAMIPAEPPKKIVVDDTEPPKKPAKKKAPAKKPATADASKAAGSGQQQNPPKPQ